MKRVIYCVLISLLMFSAFSLDLDNPRLGIRGGVGLDVTFVPAFGGEVSVAFDFEDGTWLDFALGYFHAYDKWEGDSYVEETWTDIVLIRANRLYNYSPGEPGTFYFWGTGVGVVSVSWEETSPVYPAYYDSAEGTGGLILSLGAGQAFNGGFELRLDLPVLIVFGGYYGTIISPMLGVTAGMRF